MSIELNRKFQDFVNNHELGSLPEERDRRLYAFIIQSHREGKAVEPELLSEAMEAKGFADELINKYVSAYFTGLGVLKLYDETYY